MYSKLCNNNLKLILFIDVDSNFENFNSSSGVSLLDYDSDPLLFKKEHLTTDLIRELILKGPCQPGLKENFNFKVDSHNRRFNVNWYNKTENKEKHLREWLIYSPRANRMFCFSCWLMSSHFKSAWADPNKGVKNFKKGVEKI